jgi:hypothetical protein
MNLQNPSEHCGNACSRYSGLNDLCCAITKSIREGTVAPPCNADATKSRCPLCTTAEAGPRRPDVNGGMIDATEGQVDEVRQSVIQCLLLGIGLPVGRPVRTHLLDPQQSKLALGKQTKCGLLSGIEADIEHDPTAFSASVTLSSPAPVPSSRARSRARCPRRRTAPTLRAAKSLRCAKSALLPPMLRRRQ